MAIFDRKDDYLYIKWAKAVKNRDFHCCQICGIVGGNLHSHHLNAWNAYPEQRYEITNGVTLCSECHDRFHEAYGKGDNTEEQYIEFERINSAIAKTSSKKLQVERLREHVTSLLRRDGYL